MRALFSLGQHSALNAVAEELRPSERLLAFLDDIYVVCAPDRVATIYALLQIKLWQHARIRVILGKTQLWNRGGVFPVGCEPLIRTAQASDPDAIVWRGQQGIRVLGTPLGKPEFVVEQLREVSQSHAALFEKIPAVQDLQCAWLLLLFCASTRANYLLRAVPPALSEGFARVHDTRVWECFSELLGVQAEGAPRNIAHLPFRHGGLGLASAVLSRSAACWASWADCLPMVKARHPVIAGELLHALDDQGGGIHINSASSSRDQLIGMGFLAPTWVDVANGVRPRRDDDCEDVPRSSAQGWQHEAVSIVHDRLAESICPGLTDSQRALLRSQGGHMASSPFTTPSSVIPCEI